MSLTFASPLWLLTLPFLLWGFWRLRDKQGLSAWRNTSPSMQSSWRTFAWRYITPWLQIGAICCLALALARPQRQWQEEKVTADAIDIMLAMDISLSMLSRDFDPDRLSVTKKVAADFVRKRPYDRIGLAAFSFEAFTFSPPTTDHRIILDFIEKIEVGRIAHGTAIGPGLATAVNRLKDSPAKSKVIILLTDGEDDGRSELRPETATELAQVYGIRVYTLGIGTDGNVLMPVGQQADGTFYFDYRETHFNTALLQEIAQKTRGRFYRAFSEQELAAVYQEIDQLEKTKVEVKRFQRYTDYYYWPLGLAIFLLALDILLRRLLARSVLGV